MQVKRVNYADKPEQVIQEDFDCVWIRLDSRPAETARPVSSATIQWLDWRLGGQISRLILENRESTGTVFVPTMGRLPTPLIAVLQSGSVDWKSFSQTCDGMQLKNVLFLCEQPGELTAIEKELRRQSGPDNVVLGAGGPAGKS